VKRGWRSVVACVLASSVLLMGAPEAAVADTAVFSDKKNDAIGRIDVRRVEVVNAKPIVVRMKFEDLRRTQGSGVAVFFDTRGGDPGPEFAATGGLGPIRDWQMLRVENWKSQSAQGIVRCDVDMRVRYGKDVARFDLARDCLKRPGRIRVAVHATGPKRGHDDWAPRFHRFYPWVPR
jgi:hypothetical protein